MNTVAANCSGPDNCDCFLEPASPYPVIHVWLLCLGRQIADTLLEKTDGSTNSEREREREREDELFIYLFIYLFI